MPCLRELDPLTGAVIRAIEDDRGPLRTRTGPDELVHMDVKKLGRIPDGGGWRAHGRAARSTGRDRTGTVGFDYVHSLVDDHSRLAYSEVLTDEKGVDLRRVPRPGRGYFAAHGIDRIERVMTDNAWAYKYSLREVVRPAGSPAEVHPSRTARGRTARSNGSTAPWQTEWAYRQVFTSNDRAHRRACPLDRALQHSTPPQRSRRAPADQPPDTNLMAEYT